MVGEQRSGTGRAVGWNIGMVVSRGLEKEKAVEESVTGLDNGAPPGG